MFYFTPVRKHVLNKSLIYLFIYLSLRGLVNATKTLFLVAQLEVQEKEVLSMTLKYLETTHEWW